MKQTLTTLIPKSIFTVGNFLSSAECQKYIGISEQIGYEPVPITTTTGFQMRPDIRNNSRVIWDNIELARKLWQRIANYLPATIFVPVAIDNNLVEHWSPVGLNERFRFYRYDRTQTFAPHCDGSYQPSPQEISHITLMIYLNEGFAGGETKFYLRYPHNNLAVVPETGKALCFLHYLRHEGAPVIHGKKYVLRTDIMYRNKGVYPQSSSIFKG